jgi:hypothetical protein
MKGVEEEMEDLAFIGLIISVIVFCVFIVMLVKVTIGK